MSSHVSVSNRPHRHTSGLAPAQIETDGLGTAISAVRHRPEACAAGPVPCDLTRRQPIGGPLPKSERPSRSPQASSTSISRGRGLHSPPECSTKKSPAEVAELADALGSGPSGGKPRASSSLAFGTLLRKDLRRSGVSPFFLRRTILGAGLGLPWVWRVFADDDQLSLPFASWRLCKRQPADRRSRSAKVS